MTQPHAEPEVTRIDAQNLHKTIGTTWADVKAVPAYANALGVKRKTLAAGQSDAVKSGLKAAVTRLETPGKGVENKADVVRNALMHDLMHARTSMLDSAQKACKSPSAAGADARSRLAHAIEPEKGGA